MQKYVSSTFSENQIPSGDKLCTDQTTRKIAFFENLIGTHLAMKFCACKDLHVFTILSTWSTAGSILDHINQLINLHATYFMSILMLSLHLHFVFHVISSLEIVRLHLLSPAQHSR